MSEDNRVIYLKVKVIVKQETDIQNLVEGLDYGFKDEDGRVIETEIVEIMDK